MQIMGHASPLLLNDPPPFGQLTLLDLLLQLPRPLRHLPPQRHRPAEGGQHRHRQHPDNPQQPFQRPPGRCLQEHHVGRRTQQNAKGLGPPVVARLPTAGLNPADPRHRHQTAVGQPAKTVGARFLFQACLKYKIVRLQNQKLLVAMPGAVNQPGLHLNQLTVVPAFQHAVGGQPRRRQRNPGGHLPVNGILQQRRVTALPDKAQHLRPVARRQRHLRPGLHLHPMLPLLQKHDRTGLIINDRARDFHPVPVAFLRRELQQAANRPCRGGKRIGRRRHLDFQIVRPRHHQPDREQLALMVELRRANPAHPHRPIQHRLRLGHGQLGGANRHPPAPARDFNRIVGNVVHRPD